MVTTLITTIIVLGILIFVHELGHFLVAKWAGVKVIRFSLGFGPKLIAVTRGETEYCISAIPLGGYVKMLGEEPGEELSEEEQSRSFATQPVLKRIAIVLAGPLSNFVLAVILFAMVNAISGIHLPSTEIGAVNPGSPAEKAALMAGDKVVSINGREVTTWDELSGTIEEFGSRPLTLKVERGAEVLSVEVTPTVSQVKNLFGETVTRPLVGITSSGKFLVKKVNPVMAGYYSLVQTWKLSKIFVLTVVKLIEGVVSIKTLGGPILIGQMVGEQVREGFISLINFIALISVNLAVLNLLPIPVLDGGHILFFTLEGILRRPIALRKIEMAQKVGMVMLLVLMVFVFYNDIMRLLPGAKPDFLP